MSHRRRRKLQRRRDQRKRTRADQDCQAWRHALAALLRVARRSERPDLFALALCVEALSHGRATPVTLWPLEQTCGLRGLGSLRRLTEHVERTAALGLLGRS